MTDSADTVTRNDEESRYELVRDGEVIGVADFEDLGGGRLLFPHTVIEPEYGGQGLGGVLVGAAMKDVAARGETVIPACPFVARWLDKHEVPGLTVEQPDAA